MIRTVLHAKIHRATVTQADLNYVGSITIDADLLEKSGIIEYEKVLVSNINNGERFETYVIAGKSGSGIICLNGATAQLAKVGDKVIIMAFEQIHLEPPAKVKPTVLFVDDQNKISKISHYEEHGKLG